LYRQFLPLPDCRGLRANMRPPVLTGKTPALIIA
jgi:hypothetical protein